MSQSNYCEIFESLRKNDDRIELLVAQKKEECSVKVW
jgi:hypothetical protein